MVLKLTPRQLAQSSARLYSAKAQVKQVSADPLPSSLTKGKTQISTLSNGVIVASLENNSPLTNVAVAYKAGSRYEDGGCLGITHSLRHYADLGTQNASMFGLNRNLQLIGSTLTATSNREHIVYSLRCLRDHLDTGLHYLCEASSNQKFRPWELEDYLPRMKVELAYIQEKPHIQLLEAIHKAAFRTGLGNSLYCPQHKMGSYNSEALAKYVRENLTSSRTAVIGVGIAHDDLTDFANTLKLDSGSVGANSAKYAGGEIRVDTTNPYAHVAVVAEGVSLKNPKEVIASGILQAVMGTIPNIKRGNTPAKLMQAAAKATENPFAVSCININYSDSGLFGFYLVGQPEDMGKLVKAVVDQYNAVAKGGVADKDLQKAKQQVKSAIHMASESNEDLLEEFGLQVLTSGKIMNSAEVDKLVDSVTTSDVNTIAKKIVAGKPSMAAVGSLAHTPYLDQLKG